MNPLISLVTTSTAKRRAPHIPLAARALCVACVAHSAGSAPEGVWPGPCYTVRSGRAERG